MTRFLALMIGSAVLLWVGHWIMGPVGMLAVSPMVGAMLALAIVDGVSIYKRFITEKVYESMEGEHHVFRGVRVAVWEDDDGQPWVCLRAVRKLVPRFPHDEVLDGLLKQGRCVPQGHKEVYIRADEVLEMLAKSREMPTVRFRAWLRRDVLNTSSVSPTTAHRMGVRTEI